MKKELLSLLLTILVTASLTGCTESQRVSHNISQDADNFNQVRQLTVINCISGDILFQMTGKMSFEVDSGDNELEIVVEDEYGKYKKHFVGLGTHIEYIVEDITSDKTEKYKYQLNFNPNMWNPPIESTIID